MTDFDTEGNPYVGLRPFFQSDSLHFFGRREQTAELLERLHETRFLAVVGSSGCGKSSLVRAGLIPAVLGGFLVERRDRWMIARMRPGHAPIRNLASALLSAEDDAEVSEDDVAALETEIRERHTGAILDRVIPRLGDDGNLLLLVDQFEEIFAFRGREGDEQLEKLDTERRREIARRRGEAADFVDLMMELGRRPGLPIYSMLTMRTDFLGDCDLFYGFPEAMNEGRYLVPRLRRQQLRAAIAGPARLSGAHVAPRLMDTLLNELGDRSDRLPVLQHALLRTWDAWHRSGGQGPIDMDHYEAAGKLENALAQDADNAMKGLDPELVARVFKCLTDTDHLHRRVRRPERLSRLTTVAAGDPASAKTDVMNVVKRFQEDRRNFVHLGEGPDPLVMISHESLIRQWGKLRDWVDEERRSRDRFRGLVERSSGALLRDPDLQNWLDWKAEARPSRAWARRYSTDDDAFPKAMDYLERSRKSARRARDLRRGTGAAAVVAGMFGLFLFGKQLAVAPELGRVVIGGDTLQVDVGTEATLPLELRDTDGRPIEGEELRHMASEIVWSSGDTAVATGMAGRDEENRPIWRVQAKRADVVTITACDATGALCDERTVAIRFSEEALADAQRDFAEAERRFDDPSQPDDSVLVAYQRLVNRYGSALDQAGVGISAADANLMVSDLTALTTAYREAQISDTSSVMPIRARRRAWSAVADRAALLREESPALGRAETRLAELQAQAGRIVTLQNGQLGVCRNPAGGLCTVQPTQLGVLTQTQPFSPGTISATGRLSVPDSGGQVFMRYSRPGDVGLRAFGDPVDVDGGDDGERRFVRQDLTQRGRYVINLYSLDGQTEVLVGRIELCVEVCEGEGTATASAATSS